MSAYSIIVAIEKEAASRRVRSLDDAYELRITLRSGASFLCSQLKSDSYHLKVIKDNEGVTTYINYDAIETVAPIWH